MTDEFNPALNLSETYEAIVAAMEVDLPIILWGDPGVGKSSLVNQIGEEYKVPVDDIRLSQLESVDLRGLPRDENGRTVWSTPSFFPTDPDYQGILFLDEINKGDESTQAASYQLILDRRLGDYHVPKGCRIIAAANPDGDLIPEALANRFAHITVEPSIRDWGAWANNNKVASEVIGFLMYRPQYLSMKPTNNEEFAFGSPRTWTFASNVYKAHKGIPAARALIKGLVGKGPALEFFGYVNLLGQLPTIDDIIADPNCYDITKKNPSLQAAACLMCFEHMDKGNVEQLMKFIIKAPIEFQVLVVSYINDLKKHLMGTPAITQWCIANPQVF